MKCKKLDLSPFKPKTKMNTTVAKYKFLFTMFHVKYF